MTPIQQTSANTPSRRKKQINKELHTLKSNMPPTHLAKLWYFLALLDSKCADLPEREADVFKKWQTHDLNAGYQNLLSQLEATVLILDRLVEMDLRNRFGLLGILKKSVSWSSMTAEQVIELVKLHKRMQRQLEVMALSHSLPQEVFHSLDKKR